MNLVVVSNRVARAKANEPMTGGLAAALLPVVEKSGAIWVGSSGRLSPRAYGPVNMEVQSLGAGALALLDMPADDYTGFYEGFANSALWPALHSRSDLIRVSDDDYQSYRRINAFMAQALMRFRKNNTAFWIQDYHFLALGEELRQLGVVQPIGFFLHTPWPAHSVAVGVPHHRELIEAMLAYDVIGFQTEDDCAHFTDLPARGARACRRGWRRSFAPRPVATCGVPDRHRRRWLCRAGGEGDDASGGVAPAPVAARAEARDRRRPRRLLEGSRQSHQRVRPSAGEQSVVEARGLAAADRDAVARCDRRV